MAVFDPSSLRVHFLFKLPEPLPVFLSSLVITGLLAPFPNICFHDPVPFPGKLFLPAPSPYGAAVYAQGRGNILDFISIKEHLNGSFLLIRKHNPRPLSLSLMLTIMYKTDPIPWDSEPRFAPPGLFHRYPRPGMVIGPVLLVSPRFADGVTGSISR